jgi:hypothetical protein
MKMATEEWSEERIILKGWKRFILVREDDDPKEAYVNVGAFNPWKVELAKLEDAVRAAVKDFISTEEGRETFERQCCSCFNWGDVVAVLPDEFAVKHGFIIFYNVDTIPDIRVDQNESFVPDDLDK